MHTKLIAIGNSYGIRLPKSIIDAYELDKGIIEITVKQEGILISPIAYMPALSEWENLFLAAKKNGFNAEQDAKDFSDWDITLQDGND